MNTSNSKQCTQCKQLFPLEPEFWYMTPRGKFTSECKTCLKNRQKQYRKDNSDKVRAAAKQRRENNREQHNEQCRNWYHNNRDYVKQYRKENAEHIKEKRREYDQDRREKIRENFREYRNSNREKFSQYDKKYKSKHKDKIKQRQLDYYSRNKPLYRQYSRAYRNRKYNADGYHTKDEVMLLFRKQAGYCYHCGADLVLIGYHEDHWIPLSRGGSDWIENIRLLCPYCNNSKYDKLPCEWDSRYCE